MDSETSLIPPPRNQENYLAGLERWPIPPWDFPFEGNCVAKTLELLIFKFWLVWMM